MRILTTPLLLVVFILSYFVGFEMYKTALWFIWGQTLGGDAQALTFWSTLVFIPIGLIYLVICYAVKHKTKNKKQSYFLYPLCCAIVFVVPTTFIIVMNGGGSIFSPEAHLFNLFFASSGIAFGIGYGLVCFALSSREAKTLTNLLRIERWHH